MDKKITMIVRGDDKSEHTTFVEHEGKHFEFYTNGFDGIFADDVRGFLEFLGYEVFVIHKDEFQPDICVN